MDREDVDFPSYLWYPLDTMIDEPDYVDIVLVEWIGCDGNDKVKEVLLEMAKHLGSN